MSRGLGKRSHRGRLVLLWTASIGLSAAMLLTAARPSRVAQASTGDRVAAYHALVLSAEELGRLRASANPLDASVSPNRDDPKLATLVGRALSTAGLPSNTLVSLSPESANTEVVPIDINTRTTSEPGPRSALVRRRATLVLTPLTLPQVGRFFAAWRAQVGSSAQWTPSRIEIEPRRERDVQAGADLPLRVTVVIESVALQTRERMSP